MDKVNTTDEKVLMFPDQFASLLELSPFLSKNRREVLNALIRYLEPGTLKSSATQNQIKELTGISYRTISRCIDDFKRSGLLKQWRGPTGQCFHSFYLPVRDAVFEFYRKDQNGKKSWDTNSKTCGRRRSVAFAHNTVAESHLSEAEDPIVSDARSGSGEQDVATLKDEYSRQDIGQLKNSQRSVREQSLDAEIASVIDQLEKAQIRNVAVEYLTSVGVVPFQISSDQELKIDRDELFRFLRRWNANSFMEFTERVDEFSKKPVQDRPPHIDLPLSQTLESWMYHALNYSYELGMNWVLRHIRKRDSEGYARLEQECRRDLIKFMQEHKLRTLDDVVSIAIQKDGEIEEQRKRK